MSSRKPDDSLELERDLPTTTEDILALKKNRNLPQMDFASYLQFLQFLPPASADALRFKNVQRVFHSNSNKFNSFFAADKTPAARTSANFQQHELSDSRSTLGSTVTAHLGQLRESPRDGRKRPPRRT
jgi:hypothetical protein